MPSPKFQPGNNANPKGRPKLSFDHEMSRHLTKLKIESLISKYMDVPTEELKAILKNPGALPSLEVYLVSVMAKGMTQGDVTRLEFLFNRSVGKVAEKQQVEHSGSIIDTKTVTKTLEKIFKSGSETEFT